MNTSPTPGRGAVPTAAVAQHIPIAAYNEQSQSTLSSSPCATPGARPGAEASVADSANRRASQPARMVGEAVRQAQQRQRTPSPSTRVAAARGRNTRNRSRSHTRRARSPPTVAGNAGLEALLAWEKGKALPSVEDFTMEAYRHLHEREFHSVHEELNFLRKDFVASRKTLVLARDELMRLGEELRVKTAEVASLQDQLDECRRLQQRRQNMVTSGAGASLGEGRSASTSSLTAASGDRSARRERAASGGEEATAGRSSTPPLASLALHAAAKDHIAQLTRRPRRRPQNQQQDGAADVPTTSSMSANDRNTIDLINELRRNVARRDTALEQARLDLGAATAATAQLTRQQRECQQQLRVAQERQQTAEAAAQERLEVVQDMERELVQARAQAAAAAKEVEALQRATRTAALLRPTAEGDATASTAHLLDGNATTRASGGGPLVASAEDVRALEEEVAHVRRQLQDYRARWQAAEDALEDSTSRRMPGAAAAAGEAGAAETAAAAEAAAAGGTSSADGSLAQRHRLELARLQRQHEDALGRLQDDKQRLERRLHRAEEAASFQQEEAQRQQLHLQREHRAELATVHEQLRAVKAQLAQVLRDKEHLVEELRRSTHTDTMANVLQEQNDALRRRLAELTGDAAERHGNAQESRALYEQEKALRLQLEATAVEREAALARAQDQQAALTEEVARLRAEVGAWARRGEAGEATTAASAASGPLADANALRSENKGYVALMQLNAALREQLQQLQQEKKQSAAAPTTLPDTAPPTPLSAANDVLVQTLRADVARLEVEKSRLESKVRVLEAERDQLLGDNHVLVHGLEKAQQAHQRSLTLAQEENNRLRVENEKISSFSSSGSRSRHNPRARSSSSREKRRHRSRESNRTSALDLWTESPQSGDVLVWYRAEDGQLLPLRAAVAEPIATTSIVQWTEARPRDPPPSVAGAAAAAATGEQPGGSTRVVRFCLDEEGHPRPAAAPKHAPPPSEEKRNGDGESWRHTASAVAWDVPQRRAEVPIWPEVVLEAASGVVRVQWRATTPRKTHTADEETSPRPPPATVTTPPREESPSGGCGHMYAVGAGPARAVRSSASHPYRLLWEGR